MLHWTLTLPTLRLEQKLVLEYEKKKEKKYTQKNKYKYVP